MKPMPEVSMEREEPGNARSFAEMLDWALDDGLVSRDDVELERAAFMAAHHDHATFAAVSVELLSKLLQHAPGGGELERGLTRRDVALTAVRFLVDYIRLLEMRLKDYGG